MSLRHLTALPVLLLVVAAAACSQGTGTTPDDVFGSCRVRAGVVCQHQQLQGVSLVSADIPGVDFSGSDLQNADFTDADLSGAKLGGANLSGADFTGANLTGVDLAKAFMFGTNFRNATMDTASISTGTPCNVVIPSGIVEAGDPRCAPSATAESQHRGPPVIDYFRLTPPGRCINGTTGYSIQVEWKVREITSLTFTVDGIRITSSQAHKGTVQLPFTCDGAPHPVTMEAFGLPPIATATIQPALAPPT